MEVERVRVKLITLASHSDAPANYTHTYASCKTIIVQVRYRSNILCSQFAGLWYERKYCDYSHSIPSHTDTPSTPLN